MDHIVVNIGCGICLNIESNVFSVSSVTSYRTSNGRNEIKKNMEEEEREGDKEWEVEEENEKVEEKEEVEY